MLYKEKDALRAFKVLKGEYLKNGKSLPNLSQDDIRGIILWVWYSKFKTGYNFTYIRRLLYLEQEMKRENGEYMFVSRATVLGRWHEMKKKMFDWEGAKESLQNMNFKEEIIKLLEE